MAQVNSPSTNKNKKNEYFKIGTFNIKRKTVYTLAIIVGIIFVYSQYKSAQAAKELEARMLEQERLRALAGSSEVGVYDYDEALRRRLHEMYGEPPEGFEWALNGELIALSNEDLTYEDVVYSYVRALSILDLATAQRLSSTSRVIDEYNDYYDTASSFAYASYYDSFLRKQLRLSLTSIEINQIDYTSIAADGTAVVTLNLNCLDLTNKDFWLVDQEKLFSDMLVFDETESDGVKKEQYLYDYVYSAYESGKVGKHNVVVDIVVSKENASGWLISNDNELKQVVTYEAGVNVINHILASYNEYRIDAIHEGINNSNYGNSAEAGNTSASDSPDTKIDSESDNNEIDKDNDETLSKREQQIQDAINNEDASVKKYTPNTDTENQEDLGETTSDVEGTNSKTDVSGVNENKDKSKSESVD